MAGAMRKVGVYLGLLEDSDRYDDDYYPDDDAAHGSTAVSQSAQPVREDRPAPVSSLSDRRRPPAPARSSVAELSRITTLHPRNYNEARTIGEHFREGVPVIMNLTDMDDADAKRLVDFAAGLVFGVHGSIERVTNKVFLLTPANIEITAEDKSAMAEGGFFNQS